MMAVDPPEIAAPDESRDFDSLRLFNYWPFV